MKIAISKGRIFNQAIEQFSTINIKPNQDDLGSRKLIVRTTTPELHFVIVRSSDVPTYVSRGAVALGIVGKDTLMENESIFPNLYELLDLKIAQCKLVLAGKNTDTLQSIDKQKTYSVATKYENITRDFFSTHQANAKIIKLYGSMELAPLLNLTDYIVDIVSSGQTLKSNDLKPILPIANLSARLISSRLSMHFHHASIQQLIAQLQTCIS